MLTDAFVAGLVVLSGLAGLTLSVYVYKKNPKERINKSFLYFGLVVVFWHVTILASLLTKNEFWFKSRYSAGFVIPIAGIFYGYALASKPIKKWFSACLYFVATAVFLISLLTPFVVRSFISFSALSYDVNFGPFFYVWAISLIFFAVVAIYIPFSVIREVADLRKKQIFYFLTGVLAFSLWAISVSIILPFFKITVLSNFDCIATIFLLSFTAYSVIKYNLMNIGSLFFQAFIYSLVIVAIIAILLILMFVGSFFLEQLLIWPIYLIVAFVAAALFYIGRLFFSEKRDLEEGKVALAGLLKKSEENRIRAEMERDKTATIISSFSDGLIILNEKDEIFSVNPEAEKIFGVQSEKLLNKSVLFLAGFPKAALVAAVLKPGLKNIFKKQVELGKDYVVEVSVIPLVSLNLSEDHSGHLVVLHDISHEKIVDKMKTEFVSLAAHQLRTPLSIIKWSMSMLKNGDFGKLTKKQAEIIKNTFRTNERLIFLVNDLLDVTRIEEGRYLSKIVLVNIIDLVVSALQTYKEEIEKRKIKINLSEPPSLPEIKLDAEKMKLAISNLIDNAIKYSAEGSSIGISLACDSKNIKFSVKDSGIGIPLDQ